VYSLEFIQHSHKTQLHRLVLYFNYLKHFHHPDIHLSLILQRVRYLIHRLSHKHHTRFHHKKSLIKHRPFKKQLVYFGKKYEFEQNDFVLFDFPPSKLFFQGYFFASSDNDKNGILKPPQDINFWTSEFETAVLCFHHLYEQCFLIPETYNKACYVLKPSPILHENFVILDMSTIINPCDSFFHKIIECMRFNFSSYNHVDQDSKFFFSILVPFGINKHAHCMILLFFFDQGQWTTSVYNFDPLGREEPLQETCCRLLYAYLLHLLPSDPVFTVLNHQFHYSPMKVAMTDNLGQWVDEAHKPAHTYFPNMGNCLLWVAFAMHVLLQNLNSFHTNTGLQQLIFNTPVFLNSKTKNYDGIMQLVLYIEDYIMKQFTSSFLHRSDQLQVQHFFINYAFNIMLYNNFVLTDHVEPPLDYFSDTSIVLHNLASLLEYANEIALKMGFPVPINVPNFLFFLASFLPTKLMCNKGLIGINYTGVTPSFDSDLDNYEYGCKQVLKTDNILEMHVVLFQGERVTFEENKQSLRISYSSPRPHTTPYLDSDGITTRYSLDNPFSMKIRYFNLKSFLPYALKLHEDISIL